MWARNCSRQRIYTGKKKEEEEGEEKEEEEEGEKRGTFQPCKTFILVGVDR